MNRLSLTGGGSEKAVNILTSSWLQWLSLQHFMELKSDDLVMSIWLCLLK